MLRHELVMHGAPKAGATEAECDAAKNVKSKVSLQRELGSSMLSRLGLLWMQHA